MQVNLLNVYETSNEIIIYDLREIGNLRNEFLNKSHDKLIWNSISQKS